MDPYEKYDMVFNGAVATRSTTTSPGRYAGMDNGPGYGVITSYAGGIFSELPFGFRSPLSRQPLRLGYLLAGHLASYFVAKVDRHTLTTRCDATL
jgi:hypothetical protein